MSFKIRIDESEFKKTFDQLSRFYGDRGQTKFVNAFNRAGFETRKKIISDMPSIFKKINSFTLNSLLFEQVRSMYGSLVGGVLSFRKKSKGVGAGIYLMPEELSGPRKQNGIEYQFFIRGLIKRDQYLIPTSADVSRSANYSWIVRIANALAKNRISKVKIKNGKFLRAKSDSLDLFLLTETHGRLSPGLYKRTANGGVVALYFLINKTNYRSIFGFYKRVREYFPRFFEEKLFDEWSKR